jgi:hypothetical protein
MQPDGLVPGGLLKHGGGLRGREEALGPLSERTDQIKPGSRFAIRHENSS